MPRKALVAVGVLGLAGVALIAFGVTNADDPTTVVIGGIEIRSDFDYATIRDPDVPDLPFDDNPDPAQCGIPLNWGKDGRAWVTGMWEGELIEPEVLLYDSHLRLSVKGRVPHGSEVNIVLYQENPVLDYYFVTVPGSPGVEGWVPEPFVSFDPVS